MLGAFTTRYRTVGAPRCFEVRQEVQETLGHLDDSLVKCIDDLAMFARLQELAEVDKVQFQARRRASSKTRPHKAPAIE